MITEDRILILKQISEQMTDLSDRIGSQEDDVDQLGFTSVNDVEYACGDITAELGDIRSQLLDLSIDIETYVSGNEKNLKDLAENLSKGL
jgi:hypothetical protein